MRKVILAGSGAERTPQYREGPVPEAGPGEALVRVRACSLNYRDLLMCQGQSGSGGEGEVVPLSDGAGEVVAIGPDVSDVAIGDRVAGCFFPLWQEGAFEMSHHKAALGGSIDGMLAEFVVLPVSGLVPLPAHLDFVEGACLPCAALTAWHALFVRGRLRQGQTLLCLGTGGVSIFALQLGIAAGARVLVTSSDPGKLQRAHDMGASDGICYREVPDWDREVWGLTGKQGVDHVIEVGGPGTLGKSMACLAAGGHLHLIGVLTGKGGTGCQFVSTGDQECGTPRHLRRQPPNVRGHE